LAAAPSASASSPEVAADLVGLRILLLRALRVRDWKGGEAAFLELALRNPKAFHSPDMTVAARDLAAALDREGIGDKAFEMLTNGLGTDGLDILYELVATKGRSSAALRAEAILRNKEVLARATPPLAIAFELREASCVDKIALLERAQEEGDGRVLVVLETQGLACFKTHNRRVKEALSSLRSRLSRGQ
jgi:hypothetical protein